MTELPCAPIPVCKPSEPLIDWLRPPITTDRGCLRIRLPLLPITIEEIDWDMVLSVLPTIDES